MIPKQKEAGQTGGFPEPIKIPERNNTQTNLVVAIPADGKRDGKQGKDTSQKNPEGCQSVRKKKTRNNQKKVWEGKVESNYF